MFRIEMLPAGNGDCILVEYGSDEDDTDRHVILIDGGPAPTYSNVLLPHLQSRFKGVANPYIDLLVVTHFHDDHIKGILDHFKQGYFHVTFGDIWFNEWRHLPAVHGPGVEGVRQASGLAKMLDNPPVPHWNSAFCNNAVMATSDATTSTTCHSGGMQITVLGPTEAGLAELREEWVAQSAVGRADASIEELFAAMEQVDGYQECVSRVGEVPVPESLVEGTFTNDDSKVNSSSIIFLAEYDNKCCLFTGDGILGATRFPGRGVPLMPGSGRIRFDALKVPHHGSKGNLSTSFLESIECRAYLFSSDGTRHGHPDRETVARILMANGFRDENNPITLHFNYKTPCNEIWDNTNLKKDYNYRTVYSGQAFDL